MYKLTITPKNEIYSAFSNRQENSIDTVIKIETKSPVKNNVVHSSTESKSNTPNYIVETATAIGLTAVAVILGMLLIGPHVSKYNGHLNKNNTKYFRYESKVIETYKKNSLKDIKEGRKKLSDYDGNNFLIAEVVAVTALLGLAAWSYGASTYYEPEEQKANHKKNVNKSKTNENLEAKLESSGKVADLEKYRTERNVNKESKSIASKYKEALSEEEVPEEAEQEAA